MVRDDGCTTAEERVSTFRGIECCLASRGFEVFSSVEPGIDGPHSGSNHRDGEPQATECDYRERVAREGKQYPDLDNRDRDPGSRRPESE